MTEPIFNSPNEAFNYAYSNNCKLSLEGEQLIVDSGLYYSFYYALKVLKKKLSISRFELAEDIFSRNHYYSYYYATEVLESRFKLGESAILDNCCYCCSYINNIFNGLVPLDFLDLCSIKTLELLLDEKQYKLCNVQRFSSFNDGEKFSYYFYHNINTNEIRNKDDIIRVLFKKRLLE